MSKGCANGCILRACGVLAALAFLVCALAMVAQQTFARIYAYTAPISAAESATIIMGMDIVAGLGVVGILTLLGVWLARRGW